MLADLLPQRPGRSARRGRLLIRGGFIRQVIALPWARQEFTCLARLFKAIGKGALLLVIAGVGAGFIVAIRFGFWIHDQQAPREMSVQLDTKTVGSSANRESQSSDTSDGNSNKKEGGTTSPGDKNNKNTSAPSGRPGSGSNTGRPASDSRPKNPNRP